MSVILGLSNTKDGVKRLMDMGGDRLTHDPMLPARRERSMTLTSCPESGS
jgi:hypothetical protein